MSVELDWREGEESGDVRWEQPESETTPEPARTIVSRAQPRPGRSRMVVPFLLAVLAGVLIGGAALAAAVAVRANQRNELARRDVEAAVALLIEAQRAGDVFSYGQLLDPAAEVWHSRRIAGLRQAASPPALTQVQSVRLQDDIAMAELLESAANGGQAATRTAFFRLSEGRWLLTAPIAARFGAVLQQSSPHFLIEYRKSDEPAMQGLVDLAEGSFVALCGELRCRASERPLQLVLAYEDDVVASDGALHVRSPRLTGVDNRGYPGEAFRRALARALAMQLTVEGFPAASSALRSAVGEWAAGDLTEATYRNMATLRQAFQRGELSSLDGAWQVVAVRNGGGALEQTMVAGMLAYAQDVFGSGAVGRLLDAAPATLPDALRRALDVSTDDFEAGWLEWLQAGPPDASSPA